MKKLYLILILLPFLAFSQEMIKEEIVLKNGEITLPGTLSYPKSKKKPPLVIFVHGSGNIDRNGNQGSAIQVNYIAQLADSLNQKGIAFYRYDKRTATPTNLSLLKNIEIQDFVDDVSITIENFKDDKRFKSIHLIGHSQGALVAMLALNKNIKSYISLAGASKAIDTIIINQIHKQNENLSKVAKQHFKELKETDTILSVDPNLISIFTPKNQNFFKSWIKFNPIDEIKKIKKPILILQGKKDIQINPEDATHLFNASSKNNTKTPTKLVLVENMNHVLKSIEKQENNIASYSSPEFPLSTKLVSSLTTFIFANE